jgi:predicted PurR-regulated permease PerM
MKNNKQSIVGLSLLLVFLGVLLFFSMQAYIGLFFLALILVIVSHPIYDWFVKKTKKKILSSVITSFILLFAFIIPLALFFSYVIAQASTFFASLGGDGSTLGAFTDNLNKNLPSFLNSIEIDVASFISKAVGLITSFMTKAVIPLATGIVLFFVNLTFFMLILIYLFPDRKKFFEVVTEVIPLDKVSSNKFITRFVAVTKKMVLSVFFAAAAQGTLGGLMFWFLGIPAAGFWTLVMMVAALLPLGSGLIWVPAAIILALTGDIIGALILLLWGMVVISTADNLIRNSMLKGGKTQIPEIITFLSAIGGIAVFGFFGFIYGPIIAGAFLTALDLYRERRREKEFGNESEQKTLVKS